MRLLRLTLLTALTTMAAGNSLDYLNHDRPVLDAHNCYPYEGQWKDRIDRALSTGFPVIIEEDLAWYAGPDGGQGRVVVSHQAKTSGSEPQLRDYFFERVRPIVEDALRRNDRSQWPIIVLHFDFKDVQAPLLHAVWQLLGEYQNWITTAAKTADPRVLSPFEPKPLLAITEDSDAQEEVFFNQVPAGSKLRLFGSAHTEPVPGGKERNHLLAILPPEKLLAAPPTNYRRWWNTSWFVVEEGGQHQAGDWTPADNRRLRALVDHAHQMGYWIRFYTLDGFGPGGDVGGWGEGYNFGSSTAVEARWKAALDAGVNLIATDQYEDLAAFMKKRN